MTHLLLELAAMLLVILAASELFTNALEALGERLRISEGVTGSLFAAVGTALPETLVPILAIVGGGGHATINQDIGVGAILGAPLMLSTLSTALMAFAALGPRGWRGRIAPEASGLRRDLNFFLGAFVLAALAMVTPVGPAMLHALFAVALVALYVVYIIATVRASDGLVEAGHGTASDRIMYFARIGRGLGLSHGLLLILLQLACAVGLLVWGAQGFIDGIRGVALHVGISALLLSLLVIPVATELPEKVNSILWIRRRKDTLAFGNITGAMVFQGTLLPAIGMMLTPWAPSFAVMTGIVVTLLAALWLRLLASLPGVPVWALLLNGGLYAVYLALTLGH